MSHLIELIKKTPRRTSSGHAGHIDWPLISEMLNRSEGECASKWKYQKTCLSGSSVGVTKYRSSSRIIFTPEHVSITAFVLCLLLSCAGYPLSDFAMHIHHPTFIYIFMTTLHITTYVVS